MIVGAIGISASCILACNRNFGLGAIGAGYGIAVRVVVCRPESVRISLGRVIASSFEEFGVREIAHHLVLKRLGRAEVKGFRTV